MTHRFKPFILKSALLLTAALLVPGVTLGSDNSAAGSTIEQRDIILRASMLQKRGNPDKALALLHESFPEGPPATDLALAYYRIIGDTPNGQSEALRGLLALYKANPKNLKFQLAYLYELSQVPTQRSNALVEFEQLAKQRGKDQDQVLAKWRKALRTAKDNDPNRTEDLKHYLQADPGNMEVREIYEEAARTVTAQKSTQTSYLEPASAKTSAPSAPDPYWEEIRRADRLFEGGQYEQANKVAQHAITLAQDKPDGYRLAGAANAAMGRHKKAIAFYRQAVRLSPDDAWSRYKLAMLLRESHPDDGTAADQIVAQSLKDLPQNQEMVAAAVLYYQKTEKNELAKKTLDNFLNAHRSLPVIDLRLTQLAMLESLPDPNAYQQSLEKLRRFKLTTPQQQKLASIDLSHRIRLANAQKDYQTAYHLLQKQQELDPNNPWLLLDLARAEARIGQPEAAKARFKNALNRTSQDPDWHYSYAVFLAFLGEDRQGMAEMENIPDAQRTPTMAGFQRRLWLTERLADVRTRSRQRQNVQAEATLRETESMVGDDPMLMADIADMWAELNQPSEAQRIYQKTLAHQNQEDILGEADTRLRYIRYLIGQNDLDKATLQISQVQRHTTLSVEQHSDLTRLKSELRLATAKHHIELHQWEEAEAQLQPILAQSNDTTYSRALAQQARIYQGRGALDQFIPLAQQAIIESKAGGSRSEQLPRISLQAPNESGKIPVVIQQPSHPSSEEPARNAWEYQQIAEAIERRSGWISGAIDGLALSGTEGQSSYKGTEIPLEYRQPVGDHSEFIFRADQVTINAGTINLGNNYQTNTFGSLILCQPNCSNNLLNQQAAGTALNAALETGNTRIDVGTTPLGFYTENWIGGIRQKGDLGPLSWTGEAFRRSITSTLLSYAGTRDPRTGTVWGGVVGTGASLGLSIDQGLALGWWSNLRYRYLTGTNVQSNQDVQFMTGLNWRLVNEVNRQFSTGLTGHLWSFQRNVGEFTFGQGGYYSPSLYEAVGIPLSYAERSGRWSYVISGSYALNWAKTDAAPYFPTDAAMQAQAGNPYYTASAGPGTTYAAALHSEYQLSPSLFLGARVRMVRSPYYTPNTATVYFRFSFDGPSAKPVLLRPEPVIPTSRY